MIQTVDSVSDCSHQGVVQHRERVRCEEGGAEAASREMGADLSLLRLNSLVWHLSKVAKRNGFVREKCRNALAKYLVEEGGADWAAAESVATELVYRMR